MNKAEFEQYFPEEGYRQTEPTEAFFETVRATNDYSTVLVDCYRKYTRPGKSLLAYSKNYNRFTAFGPIQEENHGYLALQGGITDTLSLIGYTGVHWESLMGRDRPQLTEQILFGESLNEWFEVKSGHTKEYTFPVVSENPRRWSLVPFGEMAKTIIWMKRLLANELSAVAEYRYLDSLNRP